ncbi:Ribosome maturation factor RimP [Gossypium australe]|uniref:Ribosome maturation factor RimP n=1 Tax=Gossypium australe TaxID=47621 RepID=A0A5B6W3P3_9ROSI|nr:Ribosome maturation factor RimP [Gossypium australe]
MAAKPLTSEAIALTEKKMDMTLDDIIKMSKTSSNKTKKQRRVLNKGQKPFNNAAKAKALKVRQYMDSRSSVRQGVLAQRRSNIRVNQFPLAAEAARRAAVAPVRIKNVNGVRVANLNKPRLSGADCGIGFLPYGMDIEAWSSKMPLNCLFCDWVLAMFENLGLMVTNFDEYLQADGLICLILLLVGNDCILPLMKSSSSFTVLILVAGLVRTGVSPVQRRAKNGGFAAKPRQHQLQQQQEGNVVTKQRPHTLDSLFANMKKERMNGPAQRQRMPWRRGRFGN